MKFLCFAIFCAISAMAAETSSSITWTNNLLRIRGPNVPGEYVEVWYLEAFCRSGSTHRNWNQTTIPHKTEWLSATEKKIRLRTKVEPSVILEHEITAGADEVDFKVTARNEGDAFVDVQWFQPCMRVDRFSGAKQADYIEKSFLLNDVEALLKRYRKDFPAAK